MTLAEKLAEQDCRRLETARFSVKQEAVGDSSEDRSLRRYGSSPHDGRQSPRAPSVTSCDPDAWLEIFWHMGTTFANLDELAKRSLEEITASIEALAEQQGYL